LLTGPDVRTLDVEQDVTMNLENDSHDDVVEDTTDDRTKALNGESDTWRQLGVLTHLEITDETTSLLDRVITVEGEVHVGLGVAGVDSSTEDLDQVLHVGGETGDGVHGDDKGQEHSGDDDADDETPPWEVSVTSVDGSHSLKSV
jgi:hypothetical protein